MNTRIKSLREHSENAVPYISSERAEIITDFYGETATAALSIPEQKAEALYRFSDKKIIPFWKGKLTARGFSESSPMNGKLPMKPVFLPNFRTQPVVQL